MNLLIASALFLIVTLIVARALRPSPRGTQAVAEALRVGAQLVDVRTPAEFAADPVPGARNIPVDQLAQRLRELDRELPVVVFCASGWRSSHAARLLQGSGFSRVIDAGARDDLPDEQLAPRPPR